MHVVLQEREEVESCAAWLAESLCIHLFLFLLGTLFLHFITSLD